MESNLQGQKSKPGKFGKGVGKQQAASQIDPTLENLEGEELIDALENKLEEFEKKLARSQGEYEMLQNNCLEIQEKLGKSKEKYKRAALMLTEFLEDLLSQKPNIFREQMRAAGADEDDEELLKIQNTPIEDLEKDDKVRVVFMLLKQLQPYLSANNLTVVAPPSRTLGSTIVSFLTHLFLTYVVYIGQRKCLS